MALAWRWRGVDGGLGWRFHRPSPWNARPGRFVGRGYKKPSISPSPLLRPQPPSHALSGNSAGGLAGMIGGELGGVTGGDDWLSDWRDAATLDFRKRWLSMSYKTERGNVDFFWLRFHALVKMLSDYQ